MTGNSPDRALCRRPFGLGGSLTLVFLTLCLPPALVAQDPDSADTGTPGQTTRGGPLDRELLRQIRRLELPPEPWVFPDPEDRIHRGGQPPIVGKLLSLSSFATVELPRMQGGGSPLGVLETIRVPRDEIEWIFLDGGTFPRHPPLLPAQEDAVLLSSGEVLEGTVQIAGDSVTVGARTVSASQVSLVRLAPPESEAVTPADSSGDPSGKGESDRSREPEETDAPSESGRAPSPKPGAEPCWHGTVDYTLVHAVPGKRIETEVHWLLAMHEVESHHSEGGSMFLLEVEWGRYRVRLRDLFDDPNIFRLPGELEVSGAIDSTYPVISQPSYYTAPASSQRPRNGEYHFATPILDGEKLGWPRWPLMVYGQRGPDTPLPASPLVSHNHLLEEGGIRMRGEVEDSIQRGRWDLKRLHSCPDPPAATPPSAEASGGDCEHARRMADSLKEYLEGIAPLAERIGGDLEDAHFRLGRLAEELEHYQKDFLAAMALAGVGDISMKIIKTLGPARLGAGVGGGLGAGIEWGFDILEFLQNPLEWTVSEIFKPEFQLYEIYQRLQILEGIVSQNYDPALTYIRENMELFSGSDNPISQGARRFVESARALGPLLRKLNLLMGESLQIHGDVQNAKLQLELWEEVLDDC